MGQEIITLCIEDEFDTPIRSKDLFKERACIYIEHEGMIYALRSTRAGKLILTK